MESKYSDIIIKYLSGECTEEELNSLNAALEASEEVKAEFIEAKLLKAAGNYVHFSDENHIDRSFDELMARVGEFSAEKQGGKTVPLFRKYLSYAAIVIGILTLGLGGYFVYQKTMASSQMLEAVATDTMQSIRLEDGTEVVLDKNSTLLYPKHFKDNQRDIQVKGHAFLKVAKDKQRPFRVKADNIYVQVLGTQFDVRTESGLSEVALIEGSVSIRDLSNKNLYTMKPGDFVSYDPLKKQMKVRRVRSDLYISWLKGEIDLNSVNFVELIDVLRRHYHKNIVVQSPELNKYELVVNLSLDIPVETMMEALTNVAPIRYQVKDDSILITMKNRSR